MKPPIYEPKGAAKEYVVYMHIFPNGKKYIGISSNVSKRFRNGKGYQNQPIMLNAIEKYGWNSIKTTILYEGIEEATAKAKEIELISKYQTTNRDYGYNQTLGGEGAHGRKVSDENKKKISERMSAVHKGVPLSDEHKKKISESLKGKKKNYSDSGRQRIIESNRKRIYSDETRKKMSNNTKKAMQEKNMGEYLSQKWQDEKEERKAKLRITMYDRYGVIPKNHSLRNDAILLHLDKDKYPELYSAEV